MGHRRVCSPSHKFETENDQIWNLNEHPCVHTGQRDAAESSSLAYPADNMPTDGAQYASHSNLAPASNIYHPSPHNTQNPHYQQDAAGLADLPADPSSVRSFYTVTENYENTASSSSYSVHPYHEDDSFNIRTGNGRWQLKRKSPCENDITNGYNNDVGSSSGTSMTNDSWKGIPNTDLHTPCDYPNVNPGHSGSTHPLTGESSVRNVRSRVAPDSEANFTRAPPYNGLPHDYYTTSRSMNVSSSEHLLDQRLNGIKRERSPTHMPLHHDSSFVSHQLNPFLIGSSNSVASVENAGHNNGILARSNRVPQDFQGTHSNYIQRFPPTFRASSSSLQMGYTLAPDEGLPFAMDSYSSRHPRPSSTTAWHSSYPNGRTRMSIERFRSFPEEPSFHYLPPQEGLMTMDLSALYGSSNPFDSHHDMRLDIDNMSYEELLALGESIGSVSTGLTDDLISKYLQESIYCSSDELQDEETCAICLEEYANMDDLGILKGCRHDFHAGCIKKWLSMKNLCPICKTEPMEHPE